MRSPALSALTGQPSEQSLSALDAATDTPTPSVGCECHKLEHAFRSAQALAAMIDRAATSGVQPPPIQVQLAQAHALSACDELESALADHHRGGPCG